MKKNKLINLLGFSLTLVPLSVVISCASRGGSEGHFTPSGDYSGLDQESKAIIVESEDSYNKVKEQANYFLFQKEQEGSIKLQKDYFAWEQYKLKQDIEKDTNLKPDLDKPKKLDEKAKDPVTEKEYDEAIKDKIKRWNKLVDINKTDWEKDDKLYDSDDFASNYPEVLTPIKTIEQKQKKIYDDKKENHIKTFPKRSDGEDDWYKNLSKDYGGASSDEEAINYLVLQQIKPKAFARFAYSINDKFTQEQYNWAEKQQFKRFSFLKDAFQVRDSAQKIIAKNDDKVYFIGNNSKIESLIIQKPELTGADKQTFFRHFLIKATPDENGYNLPWKITAADVKNLFKFEKFSYGGSSFEHAYEYIPNVFDKWKDSKGIKGDVTSEDKKFLEFYSNNSESGKKKGGSLGSDTPLQFVAKMVPGFQLGVMKYMQDANANKDPGKTSTITNPSVGNTILNELVKALKQSYDDIVSLSKVSAPTTQGQLESLLTLVKDEDIERIVGNKIKEVFDKVGSTHGIDQFYYPLTQRRFVVISSNGIHIVAYSEKFNISDENEGLQKMANEQSKDSDPFNYIDHVQTYYSEWRQFLEVAKDKSFYDPTKNTGFLKGKEKELDLEENSKQLNAIFEEAEKFANQKIDNSIFSSISKISSNYDWLLKQYDKSLREDDPTSHAYDPENLYKQAKEFGGVQ